MQVLVTGGAGFIGQHIIRALMAAGHDVRGMDRFYPTGMPCPWIVADIRNPLKVIPGLDAVVHLAAMARPMECDVDPQAAFTVNVNGTHQVLKMALASGAKKVVFSSSAHVYDIPPKYLPTNEQHPLRLNNTYTTTKLLGEQLCQLFFENHGLSYITLRLFNAYGPGQAPGYFIPDMIAKARTGHINLQGSHVTKDWVYVEDVADAFVRAISSSFVGPINIGTGVEGLLGAIALTIASEFGAVLNARPGIGDSRMCGDWARARRILGWEPKTSLQEGLVAVLDAAKSRATVPA